MNRLTSRCRQTAAARRLLNGNPVRLTTIKIYLPRRFAPESIGLWLGQWLAVADDPDLQIVIPAGAWISPGGMTLLSSCVRHRLVSGYSTTLSGNPSQDVYSYLQRMDFFRHFGIKRPESFQRRSAGGRFVTLKGISSVQEAQSLATEIAASVATQCTQVSTSIVNSVRFLLEELGCNIVQHACAQGSGYGMGQAFRKKGVVEYSFCDYGIGIFQSLSKNPEYTGRIRDDSEALSLAVSDGVSSNTNERVNMGAGLHYLDTMCQRMKAKMWLLSGEACLHRDNPNGTSAVSSVSRFPGTWVCLQVPIA